MDRRERILAKAKKLRALASCQTGNPNEVETAAAILAELILKERITDAEMAAAGSHEITRRQLSERKAPVWQYHLADVCGKFNSCEILQEQTFWDIWAFGAEDDTESTKILFDYILLQILEAESHYLKRLWRFTYRSVPLSFYMGIIDGIRVRLEAVTASATAQSCNEKSLVLLSERYHRVKEQVNGMLEVAEDTTRIRKDVSYYEGVSRSSDFDLQPSGKRLESG